MAISKVVNIGAQGGGVAPQQTVMSSAYRAPSFQPRYASGAQDFTKGFDKWLPYLMKAMDRRRVEGQNTQLAQSLMGAGVGGLGIDDSKQYMANEIDQQVPDLYAGPGKSGGQFVTNLTPNAPTQQDPQQRQIYQMLQAGEKFGNKNMIDAAMRMSQTYKTQKAEEGRYQRGEAGMDRRFDRQQDRFEKVFGERRTYAEKQSRKLRDEGWSREDAIRHTKQMRDDQLRIDKWGREDEIRREIRKHQAFVSDADYQRDRSEWNRRQDRRVDDLTTSVKAANARKDRQNDEVKRKWESNRQEMGDGMWYTPSELKTLYKLENKIHDSIDISIERDPVRRRQMKYENDHALPFYDWMLQKSKKSKGTPSKPSSTAGSGEVGGLTDKEIYNQLGSPPR